MSFGIYLTGFVVVIAGLVYGTTLMHVPTHWIVVGGLLLAGLGILTGVKATRRRTLQHKTSNIKPKDPAEAFQVFGRSIRQEAT